MVTSGEIEEFGCAALRARMAARSISRTFDRALKPCGLRITQFTLLAVISREYPMSLAMMADLLGMERSSLVRSIKRLEKDHLIRHKERGSRGAFRLALTDEGKLKLEEALPLWRMVQKEVVESLGAAQWEKTREGLAALTRIAKDE